jgi:uroporphyrinogen decarboxylase
MTSRERVLAALEQRPHDRIPVDLGGTFATGFTARAYDRIREYLGLKVSPGRIMCEEMMLVEVEAEVLSRLGVDTIGIYTCSGHFHGWQGWRAPDGTQVNVSREVTIKPAPDGGWELWRKGKKNSVMPPDGHYFDPCDYVKWRDSDPSVYTDEIVEHLAERCRIARQSTELAVVLSVPFTIFNGTNTDFLCALYTDKEEAHERVGRWVDHTVEALDRLFRATGNMVDVFAFSGDAGTQRAPLIGPDIYEEMLLPHFRRVAEHLHHNTPAKFFYHTCGSVYRLIPGFIKLGVDILNPLQVTAAEMEADRLINEFGGNLVFWGGGIDAQQTLVSGNPEQVRGKVRKQLTQYTRHPGYVFAFDHNIQHDVPPENVIAAIEEVKAFRI